MQLVLGDKDAGETMLFAKAGHVADVGVRDRRFGNDRISCKTVCSVHGDVTVNQSGIFQCMQVVDDGLGTSGRDKYLDAFCFGEAYAFYGGGRNLVCMETDKCSVYVEE